MLVRSLFLGASLLALSVEEPADLEEEIADTAEDTVADEDIDGDEDIETLVQDPEDPEGAKKPPGPKPKGCSIGAAPAPAGLPLALLGLVLARRRA
ncbi:MAG: hypothetical protein R3A51_10875 [Nannocystaceae bacterium]|nr:hypothetical protein [Myxococcales bacterium]